MVPILLLLATVLHGNLAQNCQRDNTVFVEGSCLTTTQADCQDRCRASSTCNFWTWNVLTQGCGLRNFPIGGVLDAPTQVSGSPFSSVVLQNAVFVSSVKKGLTQGGCILACQADPLCQSWVWHFAGTAAQACYLNYETPVVPITTPGSTTFTSGLRSCNPGTCTSTATTPTSTTPSTGPVLVIRRSPGTGNPTAYFNRTWVESETGFGDTTRDYFIGLTSLAGLTSTGNWRSNLTVTLTNGTTLNFGWSTFRVGSAATNYTLSVGGFWTPPGQSYIVDAFTPHSGYKFSTWDRDNDVTPQGNCAAVFGAPNWHFNCFSNCLLCTNTFFLYSDRVLSSAALTITRT